MKPMRENDKCADSENMLYSDVCDIINASKLKIAKYVNTSICMTYWSIGRRIKEDVLLNKRAEYGKQVVKNLSAKLNQRYGKGWGYKTLQHCIRAAYAFSEDEIVYATRRQLYWSHLRSIMYVKDELERQFYIEMTALEHWDTRTLDEKIDKQLYLTTALSRRPEDVIRKQLDKLRETQTLNPDMIFRSSYFLDMLGLPDSFSENELEQKVVDQVEDFMQELGSDFSLIARQKRITVDAVDYKMDLVFFHRSLRRTIVVDLKLGKFKPAYEGQMLLYLRYINSHERHPWEDAPIGLILCSEGNTEHIEYLMLDENSPIKVAQYYTQLPDKKLLATRLQRAIAIAREYQKEKERRPNE
ncbi:MAG: PDDEXK nuclease domain-containing protein [Clostridium sp.]|nr:PDDEXK nuclease domain-containing protein [Clostridium sp.]